MAGSRISKHGTSSAELNAFRKKNELLKASFKEVGYKEFYNDLFFEGRYFQHDKADNIDCGNLMFLVKRNRMLGYLKANKITYISNHGYKKHIQDMMYAYYNAQVRLPYEFKLNNAVMGSNILPISGNKYYIPDQDVKELYRYLNMCAESVTEAKTPISLEKVIPNEVSLYRDYQGMSHLFEYLTLGAGVDYKQNLEFNLPCYEDEATLRGKTPIDVSVSPCAYYGRNATLNNLHTIFALVVDLDGVGIGNMEILINQLNSEEEDILSIPRPTYIVNSGHGLHIYYMFDEPLNAYRSRIRYVREFKRDLTRVIWNSGLTQFCDEKQVQQGSIVQAFRAVGSQTKFRNGTLVTAYRVGDKTNLCELFDWYQKRYKKGISDKDDLSKKYPNGADCFYQPRKEYTIVKDENNEGEHRGTSAGEHWCFNTAMYTSVKKKLHTFGMNGHRYWCIWTLAVIAHKCGIPYEQLEKDAKELQEFLSRKYANSEQGEFSWVEAKTALKAYKDSKTWMVSTKAVEHYTGITFNTTKRSGDVPKWKYEQNKEYYDSIDKKPWRTKDEHCTYMRGMLALKRDLGEVKDTRFTKENASEMGRRGNREDKARAGAMSKRGIDMDLYNRFKEYISLNPDAKKIQISRDLGISRPTVDKYKKLADAELHR